MTNNDGKASDSLAITAKAANAGAPADDIEITDEMIEAGAKELSMFNYEFESFESGAERIFLAMFDLMKVT